MSYQISLTNGTILIGLADNALDTSTSLTLVGKNFIGYGTAIADNFICLLENSSNSTAPRNPLIGQLWWDSSNKAMKVWDGVIWSALTKVTSVVGQTGDITVTQLVTAGVAALASPIFSGVPQVPTANVGTSSNQIASTGFVIHQIATLTTGVSSVLGQVGAVTLTQLTTAGLAPIAGPTFTGVPKVPTATVGTNTTQIASTAFVTAAIAAIGPSGVTSVLGSTGSITLLQLTNGGLAPIASPTFTGIPQSPTAISTTNSNQIATTAFVKTAIGALASPVTSFNTRSGVVVLTSADVTSALGFTPYNGATNPTGYQTAAQVATQVATAAQPWGTSYTNCMIPAIRALSGIYTNSTGHPIFVAVLASASSFSGSGSSAGANLNVAMAPVGQTPLIYVEGHTVTVLGPAAGSDMTVSFIVPVNFLYQVTPIGGTATLVSWVEMR